MVKEAPLSIEAELEGKLKVYPNPLSDRFTIDFPMNYEGKTILYLIDPFGKTIELAQPILEPGGSKMEIEISSYQLRAGMYFLRLQLENGKTENLKMIIK